MRKAFAFSSSLAALLLAAHVALAGQTLTTGTGDGSLTVEVDGYGSFGSVQTVDAGPATYDPVGPVAAASTTFDTAVAVRVGGAGARQYLAADALAGPALPVIPVTGTSTQANSSFTVLGLPTTLTQTVAPIVIGGVTSGASLTQTYVFSNPGTAPVPLEAVRYLDGDLLFNGTLADGGGRIVQDGVEYLFETDSATGAGADTTLVAITASGAAPAVGGQYQISSYSALRQDVADGDALTNLVQGDGGDLDQFIDAGGGYDVTLAMNRALLIPAGGAATYTTTTIFGSFAPGDIPEPGTLVAVAGAAGLLLARKRK